MSFPAYVVRQPGPAQLENIELTDLPATDLLVKVEYSSLNYKDGLALTGKGPVVRSFPMVPGIDLAGIVEESNSDRFSKGDPIVVTGWGLGETVFGAYSKYAKVRAEHALKLPAGLTTREAMAYGTAGFTAMQCVLALEGNGLKPGDKVLVTGAGGGVGSVAVLALAHAGYLPIAASGRPELEDYLKGLGAVEVIGREATSEGSGPLAKPKWAAAVDSVGGETLAGLLRHIAPEGAVAACGLAGGSNLPTTVLPFILRGVKLLGINSVTAPNPLRERIWQRISELPKSHLEAVTHEHGFNELPVLGEQILAGQIRGRAVIRI